MIEQIKFPIKYNEKEKIQNFVRVHILLPMKYNIKILGTKIATEENLKPIGKRK